MTARLLIYGATGYTGRLIAREAARRGAEPILAGRDPAKLHRLAQALGCEMRAVALADECALEDALADVAVVLNSAGPFRASAVPLVRACLRTGAHYLDVAGDIEVFQRLHAENQAARRQGVMLLPGAGFTVAASDCLAAHVVARLPGARALAIGISRPPLWSRGSMQTLMDLWSDRVEVRRDGVLESLPIGALSREFDYGWGERPSSAMRWPDAFTAYLSTGVPDVEVYGEVDAADRLLMELTRRFGRLADAGPWRTFMKRQWDCLPDGPSDAARERVERVVVAEARDGAGARVFSRLRTPESYSFTIVAALAVAERALRGEVQPGFQTPALAYGPELVLGQEGVFLEDR